MAYISQNLDTIAARFSAICQKAGRNPEEVKLLAASKTRGINLIQAALHAGQTSFGESYLQEAESKITALPNLDWHFIGAIQSNKTRQIANQFNWVHTLASGKVARRLSEQRNPAMDRLQVLVQVNISMEENKSGIAPDQASALVETIRDLPGIALRGLMAIPEATSDTALQHARFAQLRVLREAIAAQFGLPGFDQLSMGMSQDYEAAIMEGATWVRIGTGIFGPRPPKAQIANQQQDRRCQT